MYSISLQYFPVVVVPGVPDVVPLVIPVPAVATLGAVYPTVPTDAPVVAGEAEPDGWVPAWEVLPVAPVVPKQTKRFLDRILDCKLSNVYLMLLL